MLHAFYLKIIMWNTMCDKIKGKLHQIEEYLNPSLSEKYLLKHYSLDLFLKLYYPT